MYRADLAFVHHRGFGFHAEASAPGILERLAPVRARDGLVLEIGCGSGLLTRSLVEAGHRVLATDASDAMLALARDHAPGAAVARLVLPDDPVPEADAIVGVGHALNYLPDAAAIDRAWLALARALRPGGVLLVDVCDLEWARARTGDPGRGWAGDDWAIVTRWEIPAPDRFVREMATFVRNGDGTWRRDDERHENVLVDTTAIPGLLATEGVDAVVLGAFGDETPPAGLRVVAGHRPG